ncbi:MAG: hybrid sensor histidine kinase/response regulator [Synechococcales bacterium]|nr:hybrid sensor histidine kinase/response regulator [Synechococcales bacterium]
MPIPSIIHQEDYANFLSEAGDLLQTIEQELFNLRQDRTPARIHTLMRAAHTLKGSAASIQLETIKSVAHVLEDVFRVLYNPEVVIDAEVEALLFQAYECLRSPLVAELTGTTVDEAEVSERTATVLSQLQSKLGDLFDQETPIPTSLELGFDLVQSMFEGGVEQRLQTLEQALAQSDLAALTTQLQSQTEILLGLAESLQLEGFGAIAQTTLAALAAYPDQVKQIAPLAIADFRKGQAAVLAGDRTQGGTPSTALQQLVQTGQPVRVDQEATASTLRGGKGEPQDPGIDQSDSQHQGSNGYRAENYLSAQSALQKQPWPLLQRLKKVFSLEPSRPPEPAVPSPPPTTDDSLEGFFNQIQPEPVSSPPLAPPSLDFQPDPLQATPQPEISPSDLTEPEPLPPASSSLFSDLPLPSPLMRDRSSAATPPGISSPTDQSPTPDSVPTPVVRVNLGQLERLDYLVGELLINQNQQITQDDQLRLAVQELLFHLQKHKRTLNSLQNWSDLTLAINSSSVQQLIPDVMVGFDALEMDRYTDFHMLVQSALNDLVQLEIVGESLETQIRQARQARETQKRLLTSIQDDLTTARMQPLSDTLNRLPRVLQQLATAHSKPVEMSLSGMSVLIDKAIAERLYNPLLHLVRNAFDHGIESPALRKSKGKPEVGHIQIHAYHQGNRTFIEIRDDGQGIDWQRVAEKAIALGLVSAEAAAGISNSELAEFLFQSGFSTASQVNDLSGRGVGLDMVRTEVQALKGTVSVSSTFGQGATFILSLPLSFSITRLMICQDQGMSYALPINMIQQVILPQPDQLMQTSGQQIVLRWQLGQVDQMVPVYALSSLLNGSYSNPLQGDTAPRTPIILLQANEELWGLQVDQVIGEQELVIRPLGRAIAPPPYVYGCSILSDRQMALVIDPVLLQKSRTTPFSPIPPTQSPSKSIPVAIKASSSPFHILLIEDSLTVRHSLARILQGHGYQISQAGDGLEAFAYLQQDSQVHLIISDIEMPRMSGFEFLSQLRKTPVLQSIPVVMLTSRSGSKYRQLAASLGADAFVNKPSSAEELLPILDSLIGLSDLDGGSPVTAGVHNLRPATVRI